MPSFLGIQIKISAAPSHNGLICSKFDCDSDNFSVTLSLSIKMYLAMNFLRIYLVGKCASARSVEPAYGHYKCLVCPKGCQYTV